MYSDHGHGTGGMLTSHWHFCRRKIQCNQCLFCNSKLGVKKTELLYNTISHLNDSSPLLAAVIALFITFFHVFSRNIDWGAYKKDLIEAALTGFHGLFLERKYEKMYIPVYPSFTAAYKNPKTLSVCRGFH